jgi:hypothetical protein
MTSIPGRLLAKAQGVGVFVGLCIHAVARPMLPKPEMCCSSLFSAAQPSPPEPEPRNNRIPGSRFKS